MRGGTALLLGAAGLLAAGGLLACSGLLGLTDPGVFPAETGAPDPNAPTAPEDPSGPADPTIGPDAASCNGAALDRDPRNCGSCRHDCGRGQCTNGMCQSYELGALPAPVYDLAVDGSNVYAVTFEPVTTGALYRIPKTGGASEKLVATDVAHVAADALSLFYSVLEPDAPDGSPRVAIHRCDLADCAHDVQISHASSVMTFAPATGFGGTEDIAWLDAYRGFLAVPTADPTMSKKLAQLTGSDRMRLHAVGDALCYSDTNKTVGCLKRGATTPTTWDTTPNQIDDFALAGDDIVFTSGNFVWRGTLGATAVVDVKKLATVATADLIARDGNTLYVQTADAIYTCDVRDCAKPATLAAAPKQSDGGKQRILTMTLDGATIWYTTFDGEVFGVAR